MAETIALQSLGIVKNSVTDIDNGQDWNEIESAIVVNDEFIAGLKGVEAYAQLAIVFLLHKFRFDPATELQQVAPNSGESVGIFALRTYHRPNSIGVTTVRLLRVENDTLYVKGLDALDGSPVLDIKPPAPYVVKPPPPPTRDPEI